MFILLWNLPGNLISMSRYAINIRCSADCVSLYYGMSYNGNPLSSLGLSVKLTASSSINVSVSADLRNTFAFPFALKIFSSV